MSTASGSICESCASRKADILLLTRAQAFIVAAIGVAGGVVAGWCVEFPVGAVLTPLLGLVYGAALREVAARTVGRRRGARVGVIAGFYLLVGAVAARMLVAWFLLARGASVRPPLGVLYVLVDLFSPSPVPAITLAAVVVGLLAVRRR